jgi:hypothetical protein
MDEASRQDDHCHGRGGGDRRDVCGGARAGGAVVSIADVADGTSIAAELTSGGPGSAVFARTDVGDEESVRALVSTVVGTAGGSTC